ncbi:hypothetical protein BGZ52_009047 [Haplosporangium bisporale]|nr:hypothetical protein BGZ52_009047 [Haplosporangium bisporale]
MKDQALADARPTYVSAPSVSGEDMVKAIESSRKSSEGSLESGNDPFSKGADPFANQLEAAIEASLRNTSSRNRAGHKDSRHDRAGALATETKIPDLQAEYLVGPAKWESVNAKDVPIKNVTPRNMPKVAILEHGLDRVLFNPGVHWLQDPRSAVFNFDPYLRRICQPKDFDYNALQAYKTSSKDQSLFKITHRHNAKYMGSTSSMTSLLSQFYFLISAWKPLKTNHLSGAFAAQPKGFTRLSRAPSTIQLVYKGNGIYAIDADKSFDSSTVLLQLGKSMEKMLTSTPQEFSRFTKKNSWQVSQSERDAPEAFNYITADSNFMLRSQLDCEDPRLPGKTFDLKTRAAVAIRLDVHNYELNQGYQLRKTHGILESFEREYYDMMRSAFLKYSLQVRIGQMDGIFVAFHNTARIFGFQYISLDEMDSRLFGSTVMGDECFKNQLRLLNRTLDEITTKYPEQDLKITVDTDESVQSMNVWVETMPLGAAASERGKDVDLTFDENGAPEMQQGAELSLWQIVCYSRINNSTIVGPFELNDRGTDNWDLRYKIGELKKPHMMNEYRRMKAIQAEILSNDEERNAVEAATATAAAEVADFEENSEETAARLRKEIQAAKAASRRDTMRSNLRRISERGRMHEEDQERRQGDSNFVIWEPKGYVKISSAPASTLFSGSLASPTSPIAATPSAILTETAASINRTTSLNLTAEVSGESISEKMVQRLRETQSKGHVTTKDDIKSTTTTDANQNISSRDNVVYVRPSDKKTRLIPLVDFDLIRKSVTSGLTDPAEIQDLNNLKVYHGELMSAMKPFDEIQWKIWMTPPQRSVYAKMSRGRLERMAREMHLPNVSGLADTELCQRVFDQSPVFRCQLAVDYFYGHLHRVMTGQADAKPFRSLDEFVAMDPTEEQLERALDGLSINQKAVDTFFKKMDKPISKADGLKTILLKKLYASERLFTEKELRAFGYTRIFDTKKFPFQGDLMTLLRPSATDEKSQLDIDHVQENTSLSSDTMGAKLP